MLNSQFDVSKLQKQLQSVIQIELNQSAEFGLLPLIVCVTVSHNVAFNSTKTLKIPRNIKNRDKHINEASKQTFANNLFKVSCKHTQGMLSNSKICFNVINIRTYDETLCILSKINETVV